MSEGTTVTEGDERERLRRYLSRRAEDGEFYFKSKFIADDVGLSTKELGVLLSQLRDSSEGPHIEKWAYTGATTWRVVGDK